MNSNPAYYYDVAIVGGGLAGLASAILMGKAGIRVILFEKETYPFHKVCGEYISLESLDFLKFLGVPLDDWQLPVIDTLQLSSSSGKMFQGKLPLGGFGVSRFKIDQQLMLIAKQHHVIVSDNTKVLDIQYAENAFIINADNVCIQAKVCCGAFGKRSNLDVKWKRSFTLRRPNTLNNFIGVKYHAKTDHPRNLIALHNFKGGYCGISSVEDQKTCICYLTTAQNLRDNGNNIKRMEESVLYRNPFLNSAFANAEILYDKPLTISQISFEGKEQVWDHILLLGDAAGLIAPLCGNGMSMALQSARIANKYIIKYLNGEIDRYSMELSYSQEWKSAFSSRLRAGRIIQEVFGKQWLTNCVVSLLKPFPMITRSIIRRTHG